MARHTGRVKWHRLLLPVIDALLVNAALAAALWLRFEGSVPPAWWDYYQVGALWLTPLVILSDWAFGLYNRVWEYARAEAATAIGVAVSIAMVIGWTGVYFTGGEQFSHSILVLTWTLSLLAVGGSRFGWRQIRRYLWHQTPRDANGDRRRIIIYGAGHSGTAFARHLDTARDAPYLVCGFVDDNPDLRGMIVGTHKVLGTGDDLPRLVQSFDVDEVILAAPSASGAEIRAMLDRVDDAGVEARTLPRPLEMLSEQVSTSHVRDVQYEDLLGRDMTHVDMELEPNYVEGRTVLITGAGGSIGSEICRQLCRYDPAKLILLGRGENRIHSIYRELRAERSDIQLIPSICNFTNADHVDRVFRQHRPDVVFHAGAHKHVYLMEDHPTEAVRNNVLGTGNVARAADEWGVERFVAISTDKAVEPCNVMGASKRLCEILIGKFNERSDTKYMAVRFGNVIGSSGSVLTIFSKQAASGRPLTVTHPEATRFFMTVEEAAFLVLHAGALGNGGEVFVLEMGEPMCIYEMAREFLQMHGRDPDKPGAIRITSLRPGEKVHEKLVSSREELEPTSCPRVNCVSSNGPLEVAGSPEEVLARAEAATSDRAEAEALLDSVCWPLAHEMQMTGGE